MLASKLTVLKPLIQSRDGQHLTAYLRNDQNIFYLRRQLRETLETAYEYLAPVMKPEALVRFLAPIHNVIEDTKLLKNLKGNVGVFRSESVFRIISLPVEIDQTCVIATSFHVKPLLKWMQVDREFVFLGIGDGTASLYQGNQNSFHLVDTVIFPEVLREVADSGSHAEFKLNRKKNLKFDETVKWLDEWLSSLTKQSKPPLFVAGQNDLTSAFITNCRYLNTRRQPAWSSFSQDKAAEICYRIRGTLRRDAKTELERAIFEFRQAEELNLASKNIFHIAREAVNGRVNKLIIAEGINIFGKIDKATGGLSIHSTHLDHEDDDILDDLAQEVLAHGGEVTIAPREEIPQKRLILAILDRSGSELSNALNLDQSPVDKIERSAV